MRALLLLLGASLLLAACGGGDGEEAEAPQNETTTTVETAPGELVALPDTGLTAVLEGGLHGRERHP